MKTKLSQKIKIMKKEKVGTSIATLGTTSVKKVINMNVTQDDLVHLIVDEKLEILEKEINILSEKYKKLAQIDKDLKTELPETFKKVQSSTLYKVLKEHAKKQDVELSINIDIEDAVASKNSYPYLCSLINVFNCAQEHRNPIKYFKDYSEETYNLRPITINTVRVYITVHAKDTINFAQACFIVKVSATEAKKYHQKSEKEIEERMAVCKALHEKMTEYLNVKCNERKFKTNLIKASLEQSVEGKEVLNMIKVVGNIKMLT